MVLDREPGAQRRANSDVSVSRSFPQATDMKVTADNGGLEEGVDDELGAHLGSHRPPRG